MPVSKRRKKKKYKFRDPSLRASKLQRFIVNILFGVGLLFFGILPYLYIDIQGRYLVHSKAGVLLFVIKENAMLFPTVFFAITSMTIFFSFYETFKSRKFNLRKSWKTYSIIFAVFIISLTTPLMFMNTRYDVSEDGIYNYSIFNKVKKSYSWLDVSSAQVYVAYESRVKGGGGYSLRYSIKLNDGEELDLATDGQSKDKWYSLSIIDSILQKNNVQIDRSTTNLDRLKGSYREHAEKLISR